MLTTERIDTLEAFRSLRPAWDAVASADIHATVYVSWAFTSALIDLEMYPWFILAFKNDTDDYVGFSYFARKNGRFNWHRLVLLAGTPFADYNGFLALPGYAKPVCTAMVQTLMAMDWDMLDLKHSFDSRIPIFAGRFPAQRYSIRIVAGTSLYISLPESWEQYTRTVLSKNSRKKIRRFTKKIEQLPGYRLEALNDENADQLIETILRLWYQKWQKDWPIDTFHLYIRIFHTLAKENLLWARMIYDGDTPVVGLATILDRPHNTFFALLGTFNEAYAHLDPGKVLDAYSIRWAIENQYKIYDFMQGAFPYKFSFGVIRRLEIRLTISRKSLRSRLANFIKTKEQAVDYRDQLFSEGNPL